MTIVNLQSAMPAAILAIVVVGAGHAHGAEAAAVPRQTFRPRSITAKLATAVGPRVSWCISDAALAGQQQENLQNPLRAFIERGRTNPVMFNVARVLSPPMAAALTAYFKDLDPKPLRGAPIELPAVGRKIYQEGISDTDVPPCASCHGVDAKGQAAFSRLACQLRDYALKKLVNWGKECGQDPAKPDTSAIMESIAHGLTELQIAAVAVYLSYLEELPSLGLA